MPRLERTMKIEKQIASIAFQIFNDAEERFWSQRQLLDAWIKQVYGHPQYNKLPRYSQGMLIGIKMARINIIEHKKTAFSYVHDGKRVFLKTPEYRQINVHDIDTTTGALVWKDQPEKIWFQLP